MRNPLSDLVTHIAQRRLGHAGALLTTAALAACGTVYTAEPVGNIPVELDPQRWNGVWAASPDLAGPCLPAGPGAAGDDDADCFALTVEDVQGGVLTVTYADGTQKTAWLRTVTPVAPASRGHDVGGSAVPARRQERRPYPMLVTLEGPDGTGTTRWQLSGWAALKGDVLLVWAADAAAFRGLIAEGALPHDPSAPWAGGEDAHLGPLDGQALAVLTGPRRWDLFQWDDPVVLYRVPASEP
jgi:hypothetical protein